MGRLNWWSLGWLGVWPLRHKVWPKWLKVMCNWEKSRVIGPNVWSQETPRMASNLGRGRIKKSMENWAGPSFKGTLRALPAQGRDSPLATSTLMLGVGSMVRFSCWAKRWSRKLWVLPESKRM